MTLPRPFLAALVGLSLLLPGTVGCSSDSGKDRKPEEKDKQPADRKNDDKSAEDQKSRTGTVEGRVTYRGQPLPGGGISFVPENGPPAAEKIHPDGTYKVEGLPPGRYKVAVESESAGPAPGPGPVMKPPKDCKAPPDPGGPEPRHVRIPAKYADPEKSGLSVTVRPGEQTYDIRLE